MWVEELLPFDQEDTLELIGNLLDNAAKWARRRVHLSLVWGNCLRIRVEDDGPGVAPQAAEVQFPHRMSIIANGPVDSPVHIQSTATPFEQPCDGHVSSVRARSPNSAGPMVHWSASMRLPSAILTLVLSTLSLGGCGQRESAPDVDPRLGRACFTAYQSALPPGSQYEGILAAGADRITIRAMTGAEVESFECTVAAGGAVRPAGR
jgi:hypothetical protein